MLETNKYYLTARGNEIIGRTLNHGTIGITTVKFGSGTLPENPKEAQQLTTLVNQQQSFLINSIVTEKAQSKITVAVTNDKLLVGYNATEAGVYATDPDTGEETLFAVAKLDGNYIPPYSKSSVVNQIYSIFIVISGETNITIEADTDLYVLKKDALAIEKIRPVGSLFATITDDDPNLLWPNTKWQRLGEGVTILSAGETYKAGEIYGANTKTIAKANLPKEKIALEINEAGDHQHKGLDGLDEGGFDTTDGGGESNGGDKLRIAYGDNRPYHNNKIALVTGWGGRHKHSGSTAELGEGKPLDIMQASKAFNIWIRIA